MEKRFVAPLTEPEQQTLTSAYHHGKIDNINEEKIIYPLLRCTR